MHEATLYLILAYKWVIPEVGRIKKLALWAEK